MRCPICRRETVSRYRPFCSRRCSDIDLARWVDGAYAVPSEEVEDLVEALDAATGEAGKPH